MSFIINPYAFLTVGSGLPVTDNFNRADSSSSLGTATSGHIWTTHIGTMGIIGNQAYMSASGSGPGGFNGALATVEAGAADCTIQITQPTARSVLTFCGLLFRYVDNSNFFTAFYKWQENALIIYRNIAGTYDTLASAAFAAPPAVNGQVLKIVLAGTSIKFYVDNILYVDTTSSAHQTATKHGLYINHLDTREDDFSIIA